jgi:hypothetical protein
VHISTLCFLILKCSICSEESIDYKFVIFDDQSKRYELIGANVQFKPFEFHFITLYSNTVILLHDWVLHFTRILVILSLQFLDG